MDEKQIRSKISEGYIHVRVIVEVVGKPKKHVEDSLKDYLKKIKNAEKIIFVSESVEKAEKQEELFSAFAEVEMLLKNTQALISFCFDYMPSSIEIIEPEKMTLSNMELSSFLNDLQSKLHVLNTGFQELQERNNFYIRNAAVLLRNFLVVLLSSRPMTLKEMGPYLGVMEEDIKKVLDVMINEGKVRQEKDMYVAVAKNG
jgi:hypothetical protein